MSQRFIQTCPAWARKLGVSSPDMWNWISLLMSTDYDRRQEQYEKVAVNGDSRWIPIAQRVLTFWDQGSRKCNRKII